MSRKKNTNGYMTGHRIVELKKVFEVFQTKKENTFSEIATATGIKPNMLRWTLHMIIRSDAGILTMDNTRKRHDRLYKLAIDDMNESVWLDGMNTVFGGNADLTAKLQEPVVKKVKVPKAPKAVKTKLEVAPSTAEQVSTAEGNA